MLRFVLVVLCAVALALPVAAQVHPFPASFRTQNIRTNDATLHVRVGGQGPAVVLLHGFGDTGDMWAPLAADIRSVLMTLGQDRAAIVGHDIGTMVAYAYAARYPDKTEKLVVMDAPVPGVPPWDTIVRLPALWHFDFGGRDAERLVAGRERIYLDRFWNEFAGDRTKIDEATRKHYAKLYARRGAMRAAFAQFNAIRQDAEDNKLAMAKKLTMPVLAIGGEKSFGANESVVMRNAATEVSELVVPNAGHWLMEGRRRR